MRVISFLITLVFVSCQLIAADKKISELNQLNHGAYATNDLLVVVDTSADETKKTPLSEMDQRYFYKGVDVLAITSGGTGLSAAPIGGNFLYSNGSSFTAIGEACGAGQLLKSNGSSVWSCSNDNNSGGTITQITTGTGLTGGGISGSVNIGLGTELTGLAGLATTGYVKRTGSGTYTTPAISLIADVSGALPIANGGTGQTGANAAFNALAPSQTSNSGKYLTTDGSTTSWASISAGVSSVFSRSGAVTAQSGDYSFPQISGNADLTSQVTGVLPIGNGGTGQSTAALAINALVPSQTGNNGKYLLTSGSTVAWSTVAASSPLTTKGDIYTYDTDNQRLAVGTNNFVLTADSGQATGIKWSAVSLTASVSGILPIANGGTGQSSAANAINALVPTQTSKAQSVLSTDGSVVAWGPRIEWVRYGGAATDTNCTSDPCNIATNKNGHSAGISSVNWTGSGSYTINFSPAWSGAYACTITNWNGSNFMFGPHAITETTSALSYQSYNGSGGITDSIGRVLCIGEP